MTMRTLWMFMAAAALTSTACTKEVIENDYNTTDTEGRRVQFTISEVEGRTAFGESTDGTTYPTLWNDGDQIKVNYNLAYDTENTTSLLVSDADGKNPKVTTYNNGKNASFEVALTEAVTYPCTFYAVSPASSWTHWNDTESGIFFLTQPTAQTATADSCDPKAQVLIGRSPEYPAEQKGMSLSFSHFSAYGLLSLTGLPNSAIISTVQLTAEVPIAGTLYYDVRNKTYEGSQLKKAITITTPSTQVWFGAIPTDLSGTKLKIVVTTANKGTYTKEITLRSGSKLTSGRIAKFTVDFSDVEHEGIIPGDIWFENGKPAGIIYWVSTDSETLKIIHLKRSEPMVWNEPATYTEIKDNDDLTKAHTNTSALQDWALANPSVKIPALDYLATLNQSGDDWHWPTRNDMVALGKVYYDTATITKKNKATLKTEAPEQYAATQQFEALLTSIETKYSVDTDPLDDAAEDTNGTTYWTSCDYKIDQAWFGRFGNYNVTANQYTKKDKACYIRAVKTITNVSAKLQEEQDKVIEGQLRAGTWSTQTLREGVKVHSGSMTLFGRSQKIYVTEITPSATNQIGIYHAGATTPKVVATQATSAGALAAVNGGFFPFADHTVKTGFVRINGVDKEQGVDGLQASYAGGALVINGTTPDIKKVAGNEEARELPDKNVLVCGPLLLLDGVNPNQSLSTAEYAQRTAVGITENGTFLMVVVDGRKTSASGMHLPEMQQLMRSLRAKDALNLDGGGSTALWANGSYVHSSSRAVANIVYVK